MRTYRLRNKHGKRLGHVRGWRARRRNPSSGLLDGAIALGVGVLASVAASYFIDAALASQTPTVQDAVLIGVAGLAAWFIPNPAIVGGVVVGLLLVPAAKMIYSAMPSLASVNANNPENVNMAFIAGGTVSVPSAASTSGVSTTPGIATVPGTLTGLGAMRALHAKNRWGALHSPPGSMGALHSSLNEMLMAKAAS